MDLQQLDTRAGAEAGFTLDVLHPRSGELTGIRITLRGADSETYQDRKRELARERLGALAKSRGAARLTAANLDQADTDELELLAAATIGWEGMQEGGAAVAFSGREAVRVYKQYPWMREQVDAAIHERGNFLPLAAKS